MTSTTYEALRALFAQSNLDVDEHPDEEWVAMDGLGTTGTWLLVGQAYDPQGAAAVYAVFPGMVPEARRPAVATLLTQLNHGLVLGNFELDFSDGEVRFKCSMPVGDAPTPQELGPLTVVAMSVADQHVPAIKAVVEGADPAAV